MPGTPHEFAALAATESLIPPPAWEDGSSVTEADWRNVMALRVYLARIRRDKGKDRKPQRTAMRLFRSLLSANQRAELTASGSVVVTGSEGGHYRIMPRLGSVDQVTRNGRRWFAAFRFCIHDEQGDNAMPHADLSVAHMLMIIADEQEFLTTANSRDARDQLWNRAYLRRLRERHAVVVGREVTRRNSA